MSAVKAKPIFDEYGETVEYSLVFSEEEQALIDQSYKKRFNDLPTPEQVEELFRHVREIEDRIFQGIDAEHPVHFIPKVKLSQDIPAKSRY